jgi:SulP family sulfate permease
MIHSLTLSYVGVFRIHGPFLFGATDKLDAIVSRLHDLPPIIILRLRNMTAIDSTGFQALEKFADQVHESGRQLILCGAREQPAKAAAGSRASQPSRTAECLLERRGRPRPGQKHSP